jgi:mono/diheme cytochrome c family protein
MTRTTGFVTAALLCACALGAQAEQQTLNDRIYTEAQADSGEVLYEEHCLTCHDDKYFRPVLKRWEGQSLGIFYSVMISSMPQSNPGSLPLEEYADILAYILSQSRYPDGDAELPAEPEALQGITIANRK